jgi:hypothetical protein
VHIAKHKSHHQQLYAHYNLDLLLLLLPGSDLVSFSLKMITTLPRTFRSAITENASLACMVAKTSKFQNYPHLFILQNHGKPHMIRVKAEFIST